MKRCLLCVLPDTRPDTAFLDGVCSACLAFKKRATVDWAVRTQQLRELLDRHSGRCIVASSGGKDSHYQVLMLRALGADVTAVTATTCHLSEIGRANIDNLARYVRTVEVTPNMTVRAKLNRIALEMVGDPSWPEHVSIYRVPFSLAVNLKIPLIFYGECPNEAYGGPPGTEETRVMTQRWVSEFGGFLGLRAQDMIGLEDITECDMRDYMAPSDEELRDSGVEAHFLGQYVFWDSLRNADVAQSHGLRVKLPGPMNWWPAENQDNLQTGIHDYFGWLKYGYGRLASQISVDIRAGRITRETALAITCERDGLFPFAYLGVPLADILRRIGVTSSDFLTIARKFTNWALFEQSSLDWGQHLTLRGYD